MKKAAFLLSVLITSLIFLSCIGKKTELQKDICVTVDDFSAEWLKGSWEATISETKGIYQINRNFTVNVKSEDEVEILRASGSKELTDMDGLRDEVFYYYVSDIPGTEDIAKLTFDGLTIEGDGRLYLNGKRDKVSSGIKIIELDGRTETYYFTMVKKQ